VRQLQNFVERLVVLSETRVIGEADVRAELSRQVRFSTQPGSSRLHSAVAPLASSSPAESSADAPSDILPLDLQMRAAEKKALERALRFAKQNRSLAARLLGVSRSTLYAKLEEYGLL
jgi:two-component system response regulator AtoC